MANDLAKLNRLRVNAGKAELKSWKASQAKLDEAVEKLVAEGALDVLPGANVEATPVITDPAVAAARPEPEVPELPAPPNGNGMKHTNGKPSLARGLESDGYARHSRKAVQDLREKEKKEKREAKKGKVELSDADKKQIKDEAAARGKVDPKKDPEKAKRQEKHIAEKRAKREKAGTLKPAKEKDPNTVTAADLARELDIDPKVARAKLRRHKDKIEKIVPKWDGSWEFPKKAADDIKKILRSEK
jgi:hypothetical protein